MSWPWWAGAISASPYWVGPLGLLVQGELRPRLQDWAPLMDPAAPWVSVILPARNEAANIEACIASLAGSTYPRFQVLVVDDRSTDGTGDLARRATRGDPRFRVVAGAELPAGWVGKAWACRQGYREAIGELLLFTDADTRHGPNLLGRAVALLKDRGADLVTVLQRQEMKTFWERAVQPVFLAVGSLLTAVNGGTNRLNFTTNPKKAMANGQFMLVRRAAYEAVGGHEAIKGTVVEDLRLAKQFVAGGKKTFMAFAFEDMSTRMYRSLPDIMEGWGKNLFMALVELNETLAKAYRWALVFLLIPLLGLLPTVMLLAGLASRSAALFAFGFFGYVGMTAVFARMLQLVREPPGYAFLHPLGLVVMTSIFVRAMWRGDRRVVWRGRTYAHGTEMR